jgi:hypothetical protein
MNLRLECARPGRSDVKPPNTSESIQACHFGRCCARGRAQSGSGVQYAKVYRKNLSLNVVAAEAGALGLIEADSRRLLRGPAAPGLFVVIPILELKIKRIFRLTFA